MRNKKVEQHKVSLRATHILMPRNAEVLGVVLIKNCPCILVLVDSDDDDPTDMVRPKIAILETGHPCNVDGKRYLGSVKIRPIKHRWGNDGRTQKVMFHVFIEATGRMRQL